MSKINDFIEKSPQLLLTLLNESGEKYTTSDADFVKPLSNKTVIRWKTNGKYTNILPFTHAVVHSARSIFEYSWIRPVFMTNETVIEVVY